MCKCAPKDKLPSALSTGEELHDDMALSPGTFSLEEEGIHRPGVEILFLTQRIMKVLEFFFWRPWGWEELLYVRGCGGHVR